MDVFLGVAVLLATLTLPLRALGQQTAQDFLNGGNVKMDKGDRVGAIADFSKAIELDPNFATAYYRRGDAKIMKGGDLEGSITDYSKAIELDPNFASAYCRRGNARMYNKDWEGATADWSKVIELNPTSTVAYFNRGNAKIENGELDGAIADITKDIELEPEKDIPYIARGVAKKAKGDLDGAIADFSKAIELNPKFTLAYLHRANARKDKGDQVGADADFTQADKLQHHRELSEAETRELLSTLGGVGVQITPVAEGVVVQKVLPDTSACAAGVKSGDVITEVDSKPVRELKLLDVVHRLRGPVGSEVALTLSRKGQVEPVKMKLVRKVIPYYKDRPNCEGSP